MMSYLVEAYSGSKESLYSKSLFYAIADKIQQQNLKEIKILDLGCADGRAKRLLRHYLNQDLEYFGVDLEPQFSPQLVADIRKLDDLFDQLPWQPNVILLTDVLEHFDNGLLDIQSFLRDLSSKTSSNVLIYIATPQLYRLDSLKLSHLHYPEHKVRFTSHEWTGALAKHFQISDLKAASFITTLPYWLMLNRHYHEENHWGRLFKFLRSKMGHESLVQMDKILVKKFGTHPLFISWANTLLFECKK